MRQKKLTDIATETVINMGIETETLKQVSKERETLIFRQIPRQIFG